MTRQVGVEIEFYGLAVRETATVLQNVLGGEIQERGSSLIKLENTDIGDVTIELDAHIAHRISEQSQQDFGNDTLNSLAKKLDDFGNEMLRHAAVPVEIVFPPVPNDGMETLDQIIPILKDAGAKGTEDNLIYAFGVHLNVEIADDTVEYLHNHLLSFFLLQTWLAKQTRIDISRILSGYNRLYPHAFGIALMDQEFGDLEELIALYKVHITDRNYALDMYPVWAHLFPNSLDEKTSRLVKPRPTFHYRLPDCKLGRQGWNFSHELNLWNKVEELANDRNRLNGIAKSYRDNIKSYSDPFDTQWLHILSSEWGYDVR
jgi:hypothetical protein